MRSDTTVLEDHFVDSTGIGKKTHNKIELSEYKSPDSNYVVIRFFARQSNEWVLKNEFQFRKDDVLPCKPALSDFNNDGLKDITYISDIAARSANEIRRLFIYDRSGDKLLYITNSEDYPNMQYNKELNCIDAFLVYGGCSTVFLKLQNDSLKKFASVDLADSLIVTEYDHAGNEKIVFRDINSKGPYVRYQNYKPLREYDQH